MDFPIYIKAILIAWFWVNFQPWQALLTTYVKPFIYHDYIAGALECLMCQAFWWTLALTLDPFMAIAMSCVGYTYSLIEQKLFR